VAAIGVGWGLYDQTEKDSWKDAKKSAKIDWPVLLDEKESYVKRLFPGESRRMTYVFIDKSGKRRNEDVNNLEDLPKIVAKLVNER
jgi:hypothetical protein